VTGIGACICLGVVIASTGQCVAACPDGLVEENGFCTALCGPGEFELDGACGTCFMPDLCAECSDERPGRCLAARADAYMTLNGYAVACCPTGYAPDSNGVCNPTANTGTATILARFDNLQSQFTANGVNFKGASIK
jgi:hypothetical protein